MDRCEAQEHISILDASYHGQRWAGHRESKIEQRFSKAQKII
jgi:hypothetical protein